MKIQIISQFVTGPCGGSLQFLRAIQGYLTEKRLAGSIHTSDVFLFNASQSLRQVFSMKLKTRNKLFIHRIDGPVRLYNTMNDKRDFATNIFNKYVADATIFQSRWSREHNYQMGLEPTPFEITIINAPNPLIFNRKGKRPFSTDRKIRLIASSWSDNMKKGFNIYKWLDNNLDFSRYEMTFVGNTPVHFNNIKHVQPISAEKLGDELKKHDIFITASQKDPCSNSLIEALHCGLPAIALNDGGHPEIVGQGGLLYELPEEIPLCLEKIAARYTHYQNQINLPAMEEVGKQYVDFIRSIYSNVEKRMYQPKKLRCYGIVKLLKVIFL